MMMVMEKWYDGDDGDGVNDYDDGDDKMICSDVPSTADSHKRQRHRFCQRYHVLQGRASS